VAVLVGIRLARVDHQSAAPVEPPGRNMVPVVCGLFCLGIQWNLQDLFGGWMVDIRFQHGLAVTVGTVIGALVLFTLAFAGACLGAGRPAQVRPLRALAATGLTLVVQFSACLVV